MSKNPVIINIFAGPGAGKSTLASDLFVHFKKLHYNCELVPEYAKGAVYEGRYRILQREQLYVLAKQNRHLNRIVDNVDIIINEGPLLGSMIYVTENEGIDLDIFYKLCLDLHYNCIIGATRVPRRNINIFVDRGNLEYKAGEGRYQDEHGAIMKDAEILNMFKNNDIAYFTVIQPVKTESLVKNLITRCKDYKWELK